jgi:hypothetical protein
LHPSALASYCEELLMAAVVLCQNPACVPGFLPFNGHILGTVFGSTPTAVTVQLWPIAPATSITSAAVFINSSGVKPSTLTSITGTQGKTLTFNLGGDPDEIPASVNTVFLDIDDNGPGFTSAALAYYRASGAVSTTAPPTTMPPTTAPPTTAPPTTAPPTTGPSTTLPPPEHPHPHPRPRPRREKRKAKKKGKK